MMHEIIALIKGHCLAQRAAQVMDALTNALQDAGKAARSVATYYALRTDVLEREVSPDEDAAA